MPLAPGAVLLTREGLRSPALPAAKIAFLTGVGGVCTGLGEKRENAVWEKGQGLGSLVEGRIP